MKFTSEGHMGVGSKGGARRVEKFTGAYESVWGITKYDENRHVKVEFDSPKFHHNVA